MAEIYCKKCYRVQEYTGQKDCVQCGVRLSNWHVASQLQKPVDKQADGTLDAHPE